jgi:hypothetical protein
MPAVVGSLIVQSANLLAGFLFVRRGRNFCDLHAESAIRYFTRLDRATTWLDCWRPQGRPGLIVDQQTL